MAKIKYVGLREKGLLVHLPYPFTSMSRKQAEVTFAGPGDVQDVDAKYAGDLVTQGGGQFEFVETKNVPKAVEPDSNWDATHATSVEAELLAEPKRFGFPRKK